MPEPFPAEPNRDAASEREAAAWVARRDRGMTAKETAAFLAWCAADPGHQAAFDRQEKAWRALDLLRGDAVLGAGGLPRISNATRRGRRVSSFEPDATGEPVRPVRTPRWSVAVPVLVGLAAAIILGLFLLRPSRTPLPESIESAPVAGLRVIPAAAAQHWEDGSVVTVDQGGRVEHDFSVHERRVRLLAGEAHFKVAKDARRPFVVETGGVAVRAVGTAFSVRSGESVEVLVTEGRVQVESSTGAVADGAPMVAAGESAVIARQGTRVVATVNRASAAEIDRRLAWQSARLQFSDLPLPEVVAAFNARNRTQLVLGDAATAAVRIGGTFRADNVEGFVRLLEGSFGIQADRTGDRIVLRQR